MWAKCCNTKPKNKRRVTLIMSNKKSFFEYMKTFFEHVTTYINDDTIQKVTLDFHEYLSSVIQFLCIIQYYNNKMWLKIK